MRYLGLIAMFLWPTFLQAGGGGIDITRPETFEDQALGHHLEWLRVSDESPDKTLSLPPSRGFQRGLRPNLNFGYTSDVIWYRLRLENPSQENVTVFLHDSRNYTKELAVFLETQELARLRPEDTLFDRIVEIQLEPNTETYLYIQSSSDFSQRSSFRIWADDYRLLSSLHASKTNLHVIEAIYAMGLLFNLILLVALRSKIYLYFSIYLLATVAFARFLWGVDHIALPNTAYIIFVGTSAMFFSSLFAMDFLNLRKNHPILHRLIVLIMIAFIPSNILAYVEPVLAIRFQGLLSMIWLFLTFLVGALPFVKKPQIHTMLFLTAYLVLLVASFVQNLVWFGSIELNMNHLIQYGTALENIFLLLSQGYKIFQNEQDRRDQHAKVKHSYSQLKKLVYPHQLEQISRGLTIEDTMPVGNQKVHVIAFDVIRSSQIEKKRFAILMEDFLSSCRLMLQPFEVEDHLQSRGHMVKEMGDGFVCTVGYPFALNDQNHAVASVRLAYSFAQIFREKVDSQISNQEVSCSIGIAYGDVRAYFTKEGIVRHDMWGDGLILANRYESLSRKLATSPEEYCSYIVLQEAVFKQLPPDLRTKFVEQDLSSMQLKVRNDPSARSLAFRRFHFEDIENPEAA